MEEYEKFRLSRSNILMITLTIILLVGLIAVVVLLVISLSKPHEGLPKLNITSGRVVTSETTLSTATTTQTTTKRVIDSSPYYEINVDSILNDDLYKKRDDLTRDEATKIGKDMFAFYDALFDITNYSIFDIDSVIRNAKEGEADLVGNDKAKYGQLYDFDKLINRLFQRQYQNNLLSFDYNDKRVFVKYNDKYYRVENFVGEPEVKIVDVSLAEYSHSQIIMNVRYYNTNYKEKGYNTPNYTQTTFTLKYDDDRWKLSSYLYPMFK